MKFEIFIFIYKYICLAISSGLLIFFSYSFYKEVIFNTMPIFCFVCFYGAFLLFALIFAYFWFAVSKIEKVNKK